MTLRFTRLALGYLALVSAQIGVWALLAPQSFYDNFPGFGQAWVSVDGPYNEHLLRDVGALNLMLLVVLGAAALRPTRDLLAVAGLGSLVWGVPHLIYHLVNTDGFNGFDLVVSLGGLIVFAALGAVVLYSAWKVPAQQSGSLVAGQR